MLENKLSTLLTAATLAIASQSAAQPANAVYEADADKLARQVADFERDYARQQAGFQREQQALQREFAQQQADFAREHAAAQRQMASELARTKALNSAENAKMQRELSEAREQLARAVGDVARASAQMRQPALKDTMRNIRFIAGGNAVLGLNIEDSDFGVFVSGVTPNGPAATAGVAVGDTIVSINDVELARTGNGSSPSSTLLGQIGNVVPGDDVKLRILRGGDYQDFVVKAGENKFFRQPFVYSDKGMTVWSPNHWMPFGYGGAWSDIELVSLTPALGEYFGVEKGLLVVRAGRASELGFRDGDVIIELAGREPQSPEHALRILASFEPGESVAAAIMRQRKREALTIRVPSAPTD
ncbi:MAG TPA: PDZ domain-containing protein [Gammaproteobacteria bacterium]